MNKIIISCLLLSLFSVITYVTAIHSPSDENELSLLNVEALAKSESAYVICSGSGSEYCPLNNKSEYKEITYDYIER